MANSLTTNKICSASSFVMPYVPSRAIDGVNINNDLTSRWVTNTNNTGSYLTVNLGAYYVISSWSVTCLGITALQWPGGNALYNLQDFDLQIPTDITLRTWVNVDSVTGNSVSSITRACTATVTQYVRLNIRANKGNRFPNFNPCTSVVSFDVFGIPVSNNAKLSNLTVSTGTLTPTFASTTKEYTVNVDNNIASIALTPYAQDAGAKITVNSIPVVSGQASQAINLNVGSNIITVVVTASDGTTQLTYTVNVIRAVNLTGLTISSGTLAPVFTGGIYAYTANVIYNVDSITMTPTAPSGCTIKVNNVAVNSGSASQAIPLNVGSNAIPVVVTSQDGSTSTTYTVTVTRSAAPYLTNIDAAVGGGAAIALTPTPFDRNAFAYSGAVDYTVKCITLTPWTDAGMTIRYNGATVNSGQAVTINNLVLGDNAITLTACAADGSSKDYIVTIKRNHSTYLIGLTSSVGSVSPLPVSKTVFAYTVKTGSGGSASITPIAEDPSPGITTITLQVGSNTYTIPSGTASPIISVVGTATIATMTISSTAGISPNIYTITFKKL